MGLLLGLLAASPAFALFHLAHITEVMSGVGSDPTLQYLELTPENNSQDLVSNTRLTAFNCDGSVATVLTLVTTDLPDSLTAQRPWLLAGPSDAAFFAATGIHPDYVFTPGIPAACGMVCWGAPGVLPPDPGTWNPALLTEGVPPHRNYVDCVAYGPYSGPVMAGSGAPSGLTAGDGVHSLTRVAHNEDNSLDFTYECPTPTNFARATGSFGACDPVPQQRLLGKKLVFKLNATEPENTSVTLLSKDPASNLGGGNGSADDPTLHPSSVRVYAVGGDHFDMTYVLDQDSWQVISDPGDNLGYKYVDRALLHGPVKTVVVKPGKVVKVVGKGPLLGHTLDTDPTPVRALLTLGGKTYCLEFGGTRIFTPGVSYKAVNAPVPPLAACLP